MVSKEGLSPVKPIQDLPAPHNVPELRQVLGIINDLGRFQPNLSRVVSPMSELYHAVRGEHSVVPGWQDHLS